MVILFQELLEHIKDGNLNSLCSACRNEEHPEKLKQYRAGEKGYITEERW